MDLPYEELKSKLSEFYFDPVGFWKIATADNFSESDGKNWIRDHQPLATQACLVYCVVIFATKWFMRKREPFDLTVPLYLWNFFLAAFSIAGAVMMSSEFFGTIKEHGLVNSYLFIYDFMKGTNGRWAFLFIVSKLIELLDTLFIVLRKRPLMFLHWYHHVLTLLFSYNKGFEATGFNRWGIVLNLIVHSAMYTYYFIRSMKIKLPGIVAKIITSLQILQFVISCAILAHVGFLVYYIGAEFDYQTGVFVFASFMDVTYLLLFANFFVQSYIIGGGKAKYKSVSRKHKTH